MIVTFLGQLVPYDSAIFLSTDNLPSDHEHQDAAAMNLLKKRIRVSFALQRFLVKITNDISNYRKAISDHFRWESVQTLGESFDCCAADGISWSTCVEVRQMRMLIYSVNNLWSQDRRRHPLCAQQCIPHWRWRWDGFGKLNWTFISTAAFVLMEQFYSDNTCCWQ